MYRYTHVAGTAQVSKPIKQSKDNHPPWANAVHLLTDRVLLIFQLLLSTLPTLPVHMAQYANLQRLVIVVKATAVHELQQQSECLERCVGQRHLIAAVGLPHLAVEVFKGLVGCVNSLLRYWYTATTIVYTSGHVHP